MKPRQKTALYRFYGSDGDLLYVGITNNVQRRMESHKIHKPWWWLSARIEIAWYESRTDALQAEAVAIRDEVPLFNDAAPRPWSEMGGALEIRECDVCGGQFVDELFDDSDPADRHVRCDEAVFVAFSRGRQAMWERINKEGVRANV